jgi:hypothetical protein
MTDHVSASDAIPRRRKNRLLDATISAENRPKKRKNNRALAARLAPTTGLNASRPPNHLPATRRAHRLRCHLAALHNETNKELGSALRRSNTINKNAKPATLTPLRIYPHPLEADRKPASHDASRMTRQCLMPAPPIVPYDGCFDTGPTAERDEQRKMETRRRANSASYSKRA